MRQRRRRRCDDQRLPRYRGEGGWWRRRWECRRRLMVAEEWRRRRRGHRQWVLEHLLDLLHHVRMVHNVLALVAAVELLALGAVDSIIPIADKVALIEQRPVRTKKGESLARQVRVCTHPEHLTSRLHVRIITWREKKNIELESGLNRPLTDVARVAGWLATGQIKV